MKKNVLVIGGGPAGIEAAREAARLGLQVTMVSDGPVGGRAGWHSLLPSKVWLAAAEEAQARSSVVAAEDIVARVAAVKAEWNGRERASLEVLGVKVQQGTAVFTTTGEIAVLDQAGERTGTFSDLPVIVATGSVPVFPPGLKPDGRRVLAPRFLSHLQTLPATMLVVGAGATGCEAAYLFNALGVKVTWIVDQYGILPGFQANAGEALGAALAGQGVQIVRGRMVDALEREEEKVTAVLTDGSRLEAEMAFVAVGRRPDLENMNLWAAGVEAGGTAVDRFGRTEAPGVYVVGDAGGGVMTANKAMAQGRVAARHIAGVAVNPFEQEMLVQPVYTVPQVAQVGDLADAGELAVTRVSYEKSLKSFLGEESKGFLDLYYEEDGRVRGAVAVGAHAADAAAPVAVALKMEAHLSDLAALFAAYPSFSELSFAAAREVS